MSDTLRCLALVHSDGTISTLPMDTTLREAAEEAVHLGNLDQDPPTISWVDVQVGTALSIDSLLVS